MPRQTLIDQIKIAERDKLLAVIKKVSSENEKLQFELETAKKQSKINRFFKTDFIKNFFTGIIGIGSLLFIVNYMVIPYHDRML